MTQHQEPWQVFSQNGQSVPGKSASRDQFAHDPSLIMGAANVWLWRRVGTGIEVLLQKRALSKDTWPGFYDVSVAGHIDADETAVMAAVREAEEEIGLRLDPNKLYYIFTLRTPLDTREIDTVYLYRLYGDVEFVFIDDEVESLEWVGLNDFITRTQAPDQHQLVPQGDGYFSLLINELQRLAI